MFLLASYPRKMVGKSCKEKYLQQNIFNGRNKTLTYLILITVLENKKEQGVNVKHE